MPGACVQLDFVLVVPCHVRRGDAPRRPGVGGRSGLEEGGCGSVGCDPMQFVFKLIKRGDDAAVARRGDAPPRPGERNRDSSRTTTPAVGS